MTCSTEAMSISGFHSRVGQRLVPKFNGGKIMKINLYTCKYCVYMNIHGPACMLYVHCATYSVMVCPQNRFL